MFHKDLLRLKKSKEQLLKKMAKEEKEINQSIEIRDIYILPSSKEREDYDKFYGESKDLDNIYQTDHYEKKMAEEPHQAGQPYTLSREIRLARLIDHTQLLAGIANTYHEKYFCEEKKEESKVFVEKAKEESKISAEAKKDKGAEITDEDNAEFKTAKEVSADKLKSNSIEEIKEHKVEFKEEQKPKESQFAIKTDALNKITRICLQEFALFPADPLTHSELLKYIDAVYDIAKKQHPNVHLLLSSLPVDTLDQKVLNMCLYVQCGPTPKIEAFCKTKSSKVDIRYQNKENYSQEVKTKDPQSYYFKPHIISEKGHIISNNTVMTITTEGGAQMTQCVDICIDHLGSHSKKLVTRALEIDSNKDMFLIGSQADHIITANSLRQEELKESLRVVSPVVFVDPRQSSPIPMKEDVVNEQDFQSILHPEKDGKAVKSPSKTEKENKYSKLSIKKIAEGFLIENPPFGSSLRVIATDVRKAGEFSPEYKKIISERNKKVKESMAKLHLTQNPHLKETMNKIEGHFSKVNSLLSILLEQCEPTFLEKTFNSNNSSMKEKAKHEIRKVISLIKKTRSENADADINPGYFVPAICDLRFALLNINDGIPTEFIKKMIPQIDNFVSEMQKLESLYAAPKLGGYQGMD